MKVYSVKMDENIANSGDKNYVVQYIYYDMGGITYGGENYVAYQMERFRIQI